MMHSSPDVTPGPDESDRAGDADRLDRLRRRDEAALAELVARYGPLLMRTAWLLLRDADAADEAVQLSWLAAWDGARRTGPDTPVRAWLLGIVVRRCRAFQRAATRRRRHERLAGEARWLRAADARPTPLDGQALDDRHEAVREALVALPARLREAVVLHYYNDLRVAEVAAALGIPLGTVKSRLRKAFDVLRRKLR